MRKLSLLILLLWGTGLRSQEPLAVVVNLESGVTQLSREEVINLFMGRQKRLGAGLAVQPVDQVKPPETWARFYKLLVNKDLSEINAYWSRLFFSGQAQPPRKAQSGEEVLALVAANKGSIGFVELGKADKRVRVVLVLGGP